MGPIAKSIEFPLYIWRPDTLTTSIHVSAVIHAATVVAAGVFVIARLQPVFIAGTTVVTTTNLSNLIG
jgi:NAD(P)H-quinone oxidoreductase subunit 5